MTPANCVLSCSHESNCAVTEHLSRLDQERSQLLTNLNFFPSRPLELMTPGSSVK